ncbi:MAG: sensor histidine kinase [Bryobacteraceae bacterium]
MPPLGHEDARKEACDVGEGCFVTDEGETTGKFPGIRSWSFLAIAITLSLTTIALYLTPDESEHWHYILQRLFYFPIIVAGLSLGWRGGALVSGLSSVVYLLRHQTLGPFDWIDRYLEAAMFCLVGVLTGVLSERERKQRESLRTTARRLEEVYRELQHNVEHLKRAARMTALGHLSAGLAHEIRNPLASIEGAAYVAQTEPDPARASEFLDIIRKETARLNGLVTQFIEFARPRAPEMISTDPAALVDSVLNLVRQVAGQANVRLRRTFHEIIQPVRCDPEQMKQVLLNLVLNAIQAMPGGGEVVVSAEIREDMLLLRVSDTGPGIPTDRVDEVFDPFFTTKQNGTGLGLPIAYQIVEQHGGELAIDFNSPEGCSFVIRLPLARESS